MRASMVVSIIVGIGMATIRNDISQAQTPESQTSHPTRAFIWWDNNHLHIGAEVGKGNVDAMFDIFDFNNKNKKSKPAYGIILKPMEDKPPHPVPIMMYTGRPSTRIVTGMRYVNIILDFHGIKEHKKSLVIGLLEDTNGNLCCDISVTPEKSDEVFISSEYNAFNNHGENTPENGLFISLEFDCTRGEKDRKLPNDAVLIVMRNDREIVRTKAAEVPKVLLQLDHVKKTHDFVEWRIVTKSSQIIYQGKLAFPVGGAVPNLVHYSVYVFGRDINTTN